MLTLDPKGLTTAKICEWESCEGNASLLRNGVATYQNVVYASETMNTTKNGMVGVCLFREDWDKPA